MIMMNLKSFILRVGNSLNTNSSALIRFMKGKKGK